MKTSKLRGGVKSSKGGSDEDVDLDPRQVLKNLRREVSRLRRAKWRDRLIAVIAVGALSAVALNARSDASDAKNNRLRDQAALVGVCGVTNINRIGNQNMLTDINVSKPFPLNSSWPTFFTKWHDYWTPVECRALVPRSTAVQLCLEYPPTHDPETGAPTRTTRDPINKQACPKPSTK